MTIVIAKRTPEGAGRAPPGATCTIASGGMHETLGCRSSARHVARSRDTRVAQSFPERPITLINPYAAGGPADLLARTVADGMSETLGRPVVVENRPGAGTAIGASAVAQAKPDGYTLFIGGSPSHVITPALMKDANYDGIKDFTPIATVADVPNVLVVPPSRPYKSVKELVAAAKDADGKMTFASIGVGSIPQFLGVLLQLRADVKLVDVPYKGGAPAVGRSARRPGRHGVSQCPGRSVADAGRRSCAHSPSPTRRAPRRCPIRRRWPRPDIATSR